ncbi:hypothetical protein LG302_05465 [Halomonas organivorans]
MVIEERRYDPLVSLLVAAGLAVWVLWQPELVREMAWPWRAALVGLGVWALGVAFFRPVAMGRGEGALWRLTATRWSRAALWGFALLLVLRRLLG